MNRTLAVKKVKAYTQNPDLIKEPSMGEMADLVVLVLTAVQQIEEAIKAGRLDGKTPIPDKDYLSLETAQTALNEKVREMLVKTDETLSQISQALQERVAEAIRNLRDGRDGIVSDDEIQRAAELALGMLDLPDFDALITEAITTNSDAIRNSLELLVGENRYKVEIADVEGLRQALDDLALIRSNSGAGGLGQRQVFAFIRQAIAEGIITTGSGSVSDEAYGGTWDGVTDEAPSKNAVYDKIEALVLGAGTGDVVGPISSVNNRIVTFDGVTGKLIKDSGSVVSDFATAGHNHAGVYEPADATILKDADIGVTVAAALGANDNYVTDAEKTVIGNTSGTNTGDQTTIVGITGTKDQFNTAVSDGNIVYVGDLIPIVNGGTGLTSIAAKSIWAANSADTLVALTPGANQSIRMNSGNTAWEVYTPISSGGLTWSEVTGTSQAGAVNSAYILNNAGLVTLTIPDTAAVGDVLRVVGKGAGGWLIAQNASENINFGNITTTTGVGGSLASSLRYDCVELVCTVANTTWTVTSSVGNIIYV